VIPLAIPDLRGREIELLTQCVEDNWVSSAGPFVTGFEDQIAALAGCQDAVAVVNGTAALHLALLSAGVAPGARVIVPDFTFIATANAVCQANAQLMLVDVSPQSWTLDPELVAGILDRPDHGVAAVIAVHALGHPADMDALAKLCHAQGLPLIEDAAGAIGALYKGRPVGGLGDIGIFSFNGNKTVTAGGGGMIVTDRSDWAERARHLSTQARASDAYTHDSLAFNYRMTNVNAAIGLAQLERLDEMVATKQAIAARYDAALIDRDDIELMPRLDWAVHNCWLYSVRCHDRSAAADLQRHLNAAGVGARLFWQSMSSQPPLSGAPTVLRGVSEGLSGTMVSLPCSSNLSEEAQGQVIAALESWR